MSRRVAVLGATGFVGAATVAALESAASEVNRIRTPRVNARAEDLKSSLRPDDSTVDALADALKGTDAVVCCAGDPDASSTDGVALFAANTAVPALVGAACVRARVPRFVHVSSAVVQGRLAQLDSSTRLDAFSSYARSKAAGERAALEFGPPQTVVYRPPSVHGPDRRVSRGISRIASSPLASVAAPGGAATPQALLGNVAAAIAFLATCDDAPPQIVHHPAEGLTTADLMKLLGGKQPMRIPRPIARSVVHALDVVGRAAPRLAPHARRVEMLWFGQPQARSWLEDAGWEPPLDRSAWEALGHQLRANHEGASL